MENKDNISRRDALKRMGGIIAGTALAGTSLDLLSSCQSPKSRIIFFFTGTGNCLYVAKRLGERLYSIPQVMLSENRTFEADEIGLVYPVYYFSLPRNVEEFLYSVKLKAKYLFCIETFSTTPGDATNYLRHHAEKNGIHFDYIKSLRMCSNFIPYFDVQGQENLDRAKNTEAELSKIIKEVNRQTRQIEALPEMSAERIRTEFISPEILDKRSEDLFAINPQKCVGCDVCIRVCPKANYSLDNSLAVTSGECLYCLACANACPHKAIYIKTGEPNSSSRYINPNITVPQIIEANWQNTKKRSRG